MPELNRVRPLVEGAEGITNTLTWLISLREPWDFTISALQKGQNPQRTFELVLTINHETVHFLQGLTTAFLYSISVSYFQLFRDLVQTAKRGDLTKQNLLYFRESYDNFNQQFNSPDNGLTTVHLLEAMAVTEGFRATAPERGLSFDKYLEDFFPAPDSVYRVVVDEVARRFGPVAALDLTPKLCFIALNGDTPAKNFWTILRQLPKVPDISLWSTARLSEALGMPPDRYFVNRIDSVPADFSHPILKPYLDILRTEWSPAERLELAGSPGYALGEIKSSANTKIHRLLPPLIVASGGRGVPLGPQAQDRDAALGIVAVTALMGAVERLLSDGERYHPCPHRDCPVHSTQLCRAMCPPSENVGWSNCAFPQILSDQMRLSPAELMTLRATLI